MFKPVPVGDRIRYSYARINEVWPMPHLIDIQKSSYDWFIKEGLREIFHDISPIKDFTGNLELSFENFELGKPKYDVEECKERDESYSAPMNVKVRLVYKDTGEIKESSVFMGDFPLMTETGTFVINGAERVIVSQLVRSPGVYYAVNMDPSGKKIFGTTVIPNRGAWIEYETDINDVIYARVDRTRKLPATVLLRALGLSSNEEILSLFGEHPFVLATLEKDTTNNRDEALVEIYKKLRPGEPPTLENATQLIESTFFDNKRYDLAGVGRYKLNIKLGWRNRLQGNVIAEPLVDMETGEIILPAGTKMTEENLDKVEASGVYAEQGLRKLKIKYKDQDMDVLFTTGIDEKIRTVTVEDVLASFNYLLNLMDGHGTGDDIDHLGNRRVRCVGELLQNQFRIGLARMERVVKERMTIQDTEVITPQALINIRPVVAAIKEFFGSSQLSQFMDQNNPLAELTHKRRLSALGPGGLSRERAGYEVRDVHNSHYGRMCPIETPEGPNIGLIGSLSTFAVINKYGFMETPYRRVDKENKRVTDEVRYMTADVEDRYIIAQANEPLDENGYFLGDRVTARAKDDVLSISPSQVDYMDVSPKQVVSIATALIPFLENDDANRALMGANMQRQAVPLLCTQAPVIGTGMEYKVAVDSGVCVLAKRAGVVERVVGNEIRVRAENGEVDTYPLLKFKRSNQGTCVNQRPIVNKGDKVVEKQVLADGPATDHGELALGHNVIVAYMPWEGYNYEDAILLNEDLIKADVFTSIHIEEYDCDARDTKLGKEEITREIPNVSEEALKDLDERGIIRIGAEVRPGDILVGKVTPKGETELTAEERLLRAIFGEKAREVRDSSLRVPHGEAGKIVSVKVFSRENGDELPPGVNEQVRVHIAQKRKISEGDKMAGRHGNKGVVSRIMAREDMPFLPSGEPVHIVLNPLGVPSRMNIGQILENHLGWAARSLGMQIANDAEGLVEKLANYGYDVEKNGMPETVEIDKFGDQSVRAVQISVPVFDGAHEQDISDALELAGIDQTAKTTLYDGRTGEPFDNKVTVGLTYMLKLHHLVDDKIHARSTGPYSLVTQQPLGGKAQFGGQRFGEMEVWALEAYGAAYTLQEILTVKSDDVVGRVKTYEAIVKGENVPDPGIPESFKVLVKELQSIGLDIKVLNEDEEEISLRDSDEDIVETAREVDMDIEGRVIETTSEDVVVDDYADNDVTGDEIDAIADLGNFTIKDDLSDDYDM
ncbi:MAG: DNA-directed RNA polymerase subunit beta [Phascolarctobacterium sp.]|nr:DNA-directed RNA polymerase subunit beta [Phascolarctobacterium sp.]MBQ3114011.1 DNA-directed RNA polymerase subunit beta [Phascolarctobacterium sp.]MBQ3540305.1 DNA-directed RNA polymerase subunit beta [Phascolarctobacterium sp.]MBR2071338.1 DNA-directed RNA polymerase subunit beta [Phascolarctobacterium sp.]